ncbi:MAG: type II toxin-antitoxin system HicB family antitoxin [Peptococcaceae bacterium]|nr:type II toxin-antitoxin system HicB family antitoxin [Peptococcaceae bacterium]
MDYYLNLDYPFIVKPDTDDGGYIVKFPDLKYCTGTGDTIEQAIEDAKIAKSEWIKAAYENNISIPEPSDQEKEEEYNGRISLRIPRSLHKMVVELAKQEGVSANQFILFHLSMGVGEKMLKKQPYY